MTTTGTRLTTPGARLAVVLDAVTSDAACDAVGAAVTCEDAARWAQVVAACGRASGGVLALHAHQVACPQDHTEVALVRGRPGMLAADALLRELHRPTVLRAAVSTLACEDVEALAVACHVLNRRSFVSRDLLLEHATTCPARHTGLATLADARLVIDATLDREDAP